MVGLMPTLRLELVDRFDEFLHFLLIGLALDAEVIGDLRVTSAACG